MINKLSSSNKPSKTNQFWCNVERAIDNGDSVLVFLLALLAIVFLAAVSVLLVVSFACLGVIPTVGIVVILVAIKVIHVGVSN